MKSYRCVFIAIISVFLSLLGSLAAVEWTSDKPGSTLLDAAQGEIYKNDFTVAVWVKSSGEAQHYPVLLSNKDWASGKLIDMTTTANYGMSLSSGSRKGWALVTQPSGSWAWNVGNGRARLDYQPTAERQTIADGRWHLLAFTYIKKRKEARLFYDGKNVAIYSLGRAAQFDSGLPTHLFKDAKGKQRDTLGLKLKNIEATATDRALSDNEIRQLYLKRFPASEKSKQEETKPTRLKSLKVMAWNIWHGGRHNGTKTGVQQTVDIIKASGADVICMQETYGSGPIIADRLGYYFYLRSTNLSVLSKYPLGETYGHYDAFRLGGVKVQPNKAQAFNVFSLWIHYLPAWGRNSRKEGATAEALINDEWTTRAKEMQSILKLAAPYIENSDRVPVIIAGDFNSPSHLDWKEKTQQWHNNLTVKWPVSEQMEKKGFSDTFRAMNPNLLKFDTEENWKGGAERISWRIDYIYAKGKKIKTTSSTMWNQFKGIWPSDHPLVITEFQCK